MLTRKFFQIQFHPLTFTLRQLPPNLFCPPANQSIKSPSRLGQIRQLFNNRFALLLQLGNQPMPDKIPPVLTLLVRTILSPLQFPLFQIFNNLFPPDTQQRPNKTNPIKFLYRPNPAKTTKSCPPAQPLNHRLGIIILMVSCHHTTAIIRLRHIQQAFNPQLPRSRFNRQFILTGKPANVYTANCHCHP